MNTIKRIALVIMAAVMSVGVSQAKIIAFGIKAGLNVNKLHFSKAILNDVTDKSNSCGWTAGFMADITVPIVGLAVDASLMYTRMNNGHDFTVYEATPGGQLEADEANLYGKNFIEIPINIKYKFTLPVVGRFMKPYVFTGPDFAFRMDKGVESAIANIKSRTFQMAWNVGLGLEFLNHLQIGASYGFGCNNIVEKVNADNLMGANLENVKNNYWTVTAAYIF